jgi:hypothetical protein
VTEVYTAHAKKRGKEEATQKPLKSTNHQQNTNCAPTTKSKRQTTNTPTSTRNGETSTNHQAS